MPTKAGHVPIIAVDDVLIVAVQDLIRDADVTELLDDLGKTLGRSDARGVIFDVSTVETVDSFVGRVIADLINTARLLGAYSVIVGMQPQIAITLVEMGLELKGVRATLNVNKGRQILRQVFAEEDRRARRHHD
jgi:rsbT antagonist protein RsbS